MAANRVRVGVIGLGHNGRAWIESYRRQANAEVVAVSDMNRPLAEETAVRYRVPHTYSGPDMVERSDIDLVSIHTPDPFHAEPFVRALEAGKHVVVEKPMADNIEDLHNMVAAARKAKGRKVLVGQVLRFMPFFAQVKEIVDRGELGEIIYAEGDYIHDLRAQSDPARYNPDIGMNWYLEAEQPMVGGGVHPLDLLRWYVGSPIVEVEAMSHRIVFPEMKHDASITALYRFASGAVAKVTALYAAVSPYARANHLALYGTQGTIRGETICRNESRGFEPLPVPWGTGHPYDGEVEHVLDCIINDRPTLVAAVEGARSAAPAILAEEAARLKRAVPVPEF
ncbi:MAG: Gfo/Idh/MocA family oxidoreductase [Armatimonadetes bacterium]|nr:Gfo/Idh/MocA family oxidoreductase [Armatimonadota bacterium]